MVTSLPPPGPSAPRTCQRKVHDAPRGQAFAPFSVTVRPTFGAAGVYVNDTAADAVLARPSRADSTRPGAKKRLSMVLLFRVDRACF
jgi:hypothetical protein